MYGGEKIMRFEYLADYIKICTGLGLTPSWEGLNDYYKFVKDVF